MSESDQPAQGPSRQRPLVLPEIFDGDESFTEWICHFESVSDVNGWSDEDKLLWIRVRLTGKAHVAYTRLSHETQQHYAPINCFPHYPPLGLHRGKAGGFSSVLNGRRAPRVGNLTLEVVKSPHNPL